MLVLLGGMSAALAGVLAWEMRADMPLSGVMAAGPDTPALGRRDAAPRRAAESAPALLARPLFSPERRPPPPQAASVAAPQAPLPRLTGTMVTPDGRSAIFAGTPQPIVVREGGMIGRYAVQRIAPGEVTVTGPEGLRTIRPAFDAAPAAARQAGSPPLPSPANPLMLPGAVPVVGSDLPPPIPGTSPSLAEGPQDDMPFESNPAPSGLAIIREQARQAPQPGPRP